jgi:hypothetical protein
MSIEFDDSFKLPLSEPCACIAIDVVKSEDYKNKEEVREKLLRITNVLNVRFDDYLTVPFRVRKGDEIVGVVSSFAQGFNVYQTVRRWALLQDIKLYFGLGLGTLDTDTVNVNQINGSAVINAFRAVDKRLKNKEFMKDYPYQYEKQHVQFYALGSYKKGIPYNAINALVYTIYNVLNGETVKQKEITKLAEMHPTWTLEELGEAVGYTRNARENASKLLSRAGYYKAKEMIDNVHELLFFLQRNFERGENINYE